MRLVLVSANRERSPYPVFPIGLAYLAGPLADAGYDLEVLDLCFAEEPERELGQLLDRFRPHAILVSIRNVDNVTWPGFRSYLDGIRRAVAVCAGRAPVILGGSGFSLMPAELLADLGGTWGWSAREKKCSSHSWQRWSRDALPQDSPVSSSGEGVPMHRRFR